MADSAIEWTDAVWNPIRGCSRVSPGCDNCYAMRQAHRFAGPGGPYEGLTTLRNGKVDWSGVARFVPEMLDAPLHWRKPRRVFVNSMSDLFHHSITNEQLAAVFGVMAACPQHTFQVLTKRAERMAEWFAWEDDRARSENGDILHRYALTQGYADALYDGTDTDNMEKFMRIDGLILDALGPGVDELPWPLPNVHLGVSVEDQQRADERSPYLLQTPAAVRIVSAEPLLGETSLWAFTKGEIRDKSLAALGAAPMPGLDWVIVGGESGPGARACDVAWIRSIVEQCKAAAVPCFVKQLGARPGYHLHTEAGRGMQFRDGDKTYIIKHKKGGDPAEWPEDLRVRQFPKVLA